MRWGPQRALLYHWGTEAQLWAKNQNCTGLSHDNINPMAKYREGSKETVESCRHAQHTHFHLSRWPPLRFVDQTKTLMRDTTKIYRNSQPWSFGLRVCSIQRPYRILPKYHDQKALAKIWALKSKRSSSQGKSCFLHALLLYQRSLTCCTERSYMCGSKFLDQIEDYRVTELLTELRFVHSWPKHKLTVNFPKVVVLRRIFLLSASFHTANSRLFYPINCISGSTATNSLALSSFLALCHFCRNLTQSWAIALIGGEESGETITKLIHFAPNYW